MRFIAATLLLSGAVLLPSAHSQAQIVTVFQNGNNGYTGTQDTEVIETSPDQNSGNLTVLYADFDTTNDAPGSPQLQSLLRFDSLFGNGPNQIPVGATITGATLTLTTFDPSDSVANVGLFRMLTAWEENSTWNSMGAGIQRNGVEASPLADATVSAPDVLGPKQFNVLASMQAWQGGSANFGWAIINTDNGNGLGFRSSEYNAAPLQRPSLRVTYQVAVVPETQSVFLLASGLLIGATVVRRRGRAKGK